MAKETIGYRVNAKTFPESLGKMRKGLISIYSERKNALQALGWYGGDAYPIAEELEDKTIDGHTYKYGIVIADDGLGNGSFTHRSLEEFVKDCETKEQKLEKFLRTLYGDAFFQDNEALNYALRSFADVPTDGFFAVNSAEWTDPANSQTVTPFYKRDSQSLASRIVSVGIFYKFRRYAQKRGWKHFNEGNVKELRNEIEIYLRGEYDHKNKCYTSKGELWTNIEKIFSYDDTDKADEKLMYFLPCTLACWFYVYDKDTNKISAVAYNVGDCRCYLVNEKEGVQQISIDDAQSDGSMDNLIHYGTKPYTIFGTPYATLRARIVETEAPCALIACSDGVYDTCPGSGSSSPLFKGKYVMPYGELKANDFMFEYNFLQALRRCYSFDDFVREVVFNFYGQGCAQGKSETYSGEPFNSIKKDDSGTLSARFFGQSSPLEIFSVLRNTEDTFIDKLYNTLVTLHENGEDVPYSEPHVDSSARQKDAEIEEYVQDDPGFCEFIGSLLNKERYEQAYASLVEAKSESTECNLWGFEHTQKAEGFRFNSLLKPINRRVAVFNTAVEDWKECQQVNGEIPESWKTEPHRHVIMSKEDLQLLSKCGFGERVLELTADKINYEAEKILALYSWFDKCFHGDNDKEREAVLLPTDCERKIDNDELQKALNIGKVEEEAEHPAEPQTTAPLTSEQLTDDTVATVAENAQTEEVPDTSTPDTETTEENNVVETPPRDDKATIDEKPDATEQATKKEDTPASVSDTETQQHSDVATSEDKNNTTADGDKKNGGE